MASVGEDESVEGNGWRAILGGAVREARPSWGVRRVRSGSGTGSVCSNTFRRSVHSSIGLASNLIPYRWHHPRGT